MNRHITSEVLSAYLDYEVDLPVRRTVERHLESCQECRAHLVSMQRVVRGLSKVERVALPMDLSAQIRRQAQAQPPLTLWGRCKELFLELPRRSEMRTHVAMAMGLFVCVFLVGHGIERRQLENLALGQEAREPIEKVTYNYGEAPAAAWESPTIEIADRKFVWEERNVWVEKEFQYDQATAKIDAGSPEGQAFVRRYANLYDVLEDGARVRMVDENTSTLVELSLSHS